jgi:hypothetical protein
MPDLNPADALTYLALLAEQRLDWAGESVSANSADADLETETEALGDLADTCRDTLRQVFGQVPTRYSTGRLVRSTVDIEEGHPFTVLWHPDPTHGQPHTCRGAALDGGQWTARVDPQAQTVRVLRSPAGDTATVAGK